MPTESREAWSDWRRAHEDEYFRQRDQELVEQARRRAEETAACQRLAHATGVDDEDVLLELHKLGYTVESLPLLYVLPLLEVAWADGMMSDAEREAVISAARGRGVKPGSVADRQLSPWLLNPPSSVMCDATRFLLRAVLQKRSPHMRITILRELLLACREVASASGGLLGFRSISGDEQNVIDRIRRELERDYVLSPLR
jgi:hypothetical protein